MKETSLMAARNYAFFSSALLMMMAVGCSDSSKEESASSDMALVNDIQCNIGRGAFVSKSQASPTGDLRVSCPGTTNVTFTHIRTQSLPDQIGSAPRREGD